MSVEYDLYLNEHRANTQKAFDWLCKHVVNINSSEMKNDIIKAIYNIKKHDESKYSGEEYDRQCGCVLLRPPHAQRPAGRDLLCDHRKRRRAPLPRV